MLDERRRCVRGLSLKEDEEPVERFEDARVQVTTGVVGEEGRSRACAHAEGRGGVGVRGRSSAARRREKRSEEKRRNRAQRGKKRETKTTKREAPVRCAMQVQMQTPQLSRESVESKRRKTNGETRRIKRGLSSYRRRVK